LLRLQGVQINRRVQFGPGCELVRSGLGVVIDKETILGRGVRVYHQVTIGRAHPGPSRAAGERIIVGDDVVLGAGSKVLCGVGQTLVIGNGTIVGANAVLLRSTGSNETWAGVPARRVR
jgi:serine O-acetyltransferase